MLIMKFIIAIIITEAVTEVITKSELFRPLRAKIFKLGNKNNFFKWLHGLLDCGYCFSVWTGVFVSILFFRKLELFNPCIDWFFVGLFIHRLSNLFHNCMDRINNF